MAKHLIFLVHGMGDFAEGWSTSVGELLKKAYGAYPTLSKLLPFDDAFAIKEINYNFCFEELRSRWKADSEAVLKAFAKGDVPKGTITQMAQLGAAGAGDSFADTHLLDVFLYRFIPTVAQRARVAFAQTVLGELAASAEPQPWSVIAHSLGSAVAHDSLHALYTDGNPPRLSSGTTRAHLVAMIANVSRLLETEVDVYKSVVRPTATALDGACDYYLNVRHDWDPIPRPKSFRPLDDWPDIMSRSQGRFQAIGINAIASKNVHALEHYLGNPKVHVPLFRRLGLPFAISDDELAQASAAYEAQTPFGAFEKLQKKLKSLQLAEESSWTDVLKAFHQFLNIVNDL